MMQDDSFIKLYTINSSHSPDVSILRVCGFRKTGQPLIELSEAHLDLLVYLLLMIPTLNPSLILGMMEIILHILCFPTWKHYFFFDQPV
ncbi:hypothetical protein HanIR_Chr04g0160661 [Helianthus annuus]|nr:hypothetical protein HanIR_Chr04g0160661 [Helianthus annuus]